MAVESNDDYQRDIKPLLARRCYACHGALTQKAGLRLDTAALLVQGGRGGPAIEPGQAEASLLMDVVTGASGLRMPPEGEPLSAEELNRLRAWIDAGGLAPADERPQQDPARHWAFLPPVRPEVPRALDSRWARNPIDAFLAAEHEKRGLSHRPVADKATLLRRVALDLTGLAPTRPELHAFLDDPSENAYEKAVERLFASPQFGERWARHWMDVWRYSDWAGFGAEVRESQPHIWRWRDWIVDALNRDLPYDQMTQAMLAGDELAPEDPATLAATGYLVRNWYKFNRNSWLQNTVDHTAKAFLGLTLACARCHDHKYDPITHQDWYAIRAVFEPHDIATDRVPGQPETTKDGLVRVHDAQLQAPTYLFRRGDEKEPDKEMPLEPGLPKVFAATLRIEPKKLPATAYYPGLRPHVRAESRAAATAAVTQARVALDKARQAEDAARERVVALSARLDSATELVAARAAQGRAEAGTRLAASELTAALASLESLQARMAADDAKYVDLPDSKQAEILARIAQQSERQATLRTAEAALARAQRTRDDAQAALKPGDPKSQQAVTTAEQALARAQQALGTARTNATAPGSATYAPLTPVRPATSTGRRLAFARWVTDRNQNPLTARVAVNHIWMRHFGKPLVPTVFDFGLNGKPPSHPSLLDWLAVEFMDSGWSMKHLHRLIVTSQAYQMQSWGVPSDPNAEIDPENVFLWRMNPRRMEAELVRDNVLHLAGSLDLTMGGPDLDPAAGLTVFRRSLYFRHANEKGMTFLKLFDAANVNACYRRDESVVPQQALALANSPLAVGRARILAGTLSREVAAEPALNQEDAFLSSAFEHVLGRSPTSEERSLCREYLLTQSELLSQPSQLRKFADGPDPAIPPATDPHQRARENLVHVLINHNDFVTIR